MMAISVGEMQQRVRRELSIGSRLGHTALAVAGLGMAALTLSLLATEPALPVRTRVAFVVIAACGLGWTTFAVWVLTRKQVMLAEQQVVAATLATAVSALFFVGAVVLRQRAGILALVLDGAMLVVAVAWLVRARRRVAALRARLGTT